MALLSIPVWTIPPDWNDSVIEGLEWLTSLFASQTGTEQRQQLRLSPRRYFEFTVRPIGQWRTYFDALMSTEFQDQFYLPLWHESARTIRATAPGEAYLIVDGERAELAAATALFVQGDRPYLFEVVEVSGSTVGGGQTVFQMTSGLTSVWPKHTKVYPVAPAALVDQPSFMRYSDTGIAASVSFELVGLNPWTGVSSLPEYRSFPVVNIDTNEGDSPKGGYDRIMAYRDNKIGVPVRLDVGGRAFQTDSPAGFVSGRADADTLRSLLYRLKGRLAPAWLINPMADFKLAGSASLGASSILVERSGFTDLGDPIDGRRDVRVLLRNGTEHYHRITDSAIVGSDTETLTLDPVLPAALTPAAVKRISFMRLGRLDADRIDLAHLTDSDGVCKFSIATRAVPDLRVAADWDPPPLPLAENDGCGPVVPAQFFARYNNDPWNNNPDADPATGVGGIDISLVPGPLFPVLNIGTGFIPDMGSVHFTGNFGAAPFRKTVPYRAQAWGFGTTWNPDDAEPQYSFSEDKLTASVGGEVFGRWCRATTSTETQTGLRYMELYIDEAPQTVTFGLANADYQLNQPLFSHDPTGSVVFGSSDHNCYIFGTNPAQWSHTIWIADGRSIGAGDVLSLCVFF